MTIEQLRTFRRAVAEYRRQGPSAVILWYPYVIAAGEAFGIPHTSPEFGRVYRAVERRGQA